MAKTINQINDKIKSGEVVVVTHIDGANALGTVTVIDPAKDATHPDRGFSVTQPSEFLQPVIVAGNCISSVAWLISLMASPIATPGLRSNDSVTAGNCPRWLIASGPMVGLSVATLFSGTSAPVEERT